jgi:CheY-like chemotaxis protein
MTGASGNGDGTLRVLIVDDTPDIRFMVPFHLRTDGLSFAEAASGEEALTLLAVEPFDIVVLDYRMPGISGLDVARRLCAEQHPVQIVMYSAYVDEDLQAAARELDIPVVDKADNDRLREVVHAAAGLVPV